MRVAMTIFAVICIVCGLFPNLVTQYITEPAARAVFQSAAYIDAAMGEGYAASLCAGHSELVSFSSVGLWEPISWLLLLCITLLAVTIVAIGSKYDTVNAAETVDAKHDVFFGGEKSVPSHVAGGDLFWGFKHNFRGYFALMHKLHSGIVNDYALWAAVDAALIVLFALIVL